MSPRPGRKIDLIPFNQMAINPIANSAQRTAANVRIADRNFMVPTFWNAVPVAFLHRLLNLRQPSHYGFV